MNEIIKELCEVQEKHGVETDKSTAKLSSSALLPAQGFNRAIIEFSVVAFQPQKKEG